MESFTEDTLFNITSYLTSHEILNLGLTCKYFGGKPGGVVDTDNNKKRTKRRKKNNSTTAEPSEEKRERQWSLMEEMAKRRVDNTKKDTNWQGKWKGTDVYKLTSRTGNESWIRIDNCIQKMNSELVFSRFIGNSFGYVKKNPSHIQMRRATSDMPMSNSIAVCQNVMTEGRHYVEYTVTREGAFSPGIIYPIQNSHEAKLFKNIPSYEAENNFSPASWGRLWADVMERHARVCNSQGWNASCSKNQFLFDNEGAYVYQRISLRQKGTVMGVLLDFNKDMMQIYVDGRCAATYSSMYSGGQYSWGVLLDSDSSISSFGGAVNIERKPPPVEVEVISPLV